MIYVLMKSHSYLRSNEDIKSLISYLTNKTDVADSDMKINWNSQLVKFKFNKIQLSLFESWIPSNFTTKSEWEVHDEETNERYLAQTEPNILGIRKSVMLPMFPASDIWDY